jgi:hypothetical protein
MTVVGKVTIGDVVPDDMQSDYSQTVLDTTLAEARNIVVFQMPPPEGMTDEDVKELNDLYNKYKSQGGNTSNAFWSKVTSGAYWNKKAKPADDAYWDKSVDENEAYWDKHNS